MTAGCEFGAIVHACTQALVALPFIVGGVSKLRDQSGPRRLWQAAGLNIGLPWRALPAVELLVGIAILSGLTGGWIAASGLLVVMTAVLVRATLRGYHSDCGCLGALETGRDSRTPIGRNLALLSLAVVGFGTTLSCGGGAAWQHSAMTLVVVATATAAAVVLYASWVQAERLFRGHPSFSSQGR